MNQYWPKHRRHDRRPENLLAYLAKLIDTGTLDSLYIGGESYPWLPRGKS